MKLSGEFWIIPNSTIAMNDDYSCSLNSCEGINIYIYFSFVTIYCDVREYFLSSAELQRQTFPTNISQQLTVKGIPVIKYQLKTVILEEDEIMISFDVSSLYTNVPVMAAILLCTDKLYNMPVNKRPPIDRETFITLAKVASCEVVLCLLTMASINRLMVWPW